MGEKTRRPQGPDEVAHAVTSPSHRFVVGFTPVELDEGVVLKGPAAGGDTKITVSHIMFFGCTNVFFFADTFDTRHKNTTDSKTLGTELF